jgi:hypothetical protein
VAVVEQIPAVSLAVAGVEMVAPVMVAGASAVVVVDEVVVVASAADEPERVNGTRAAAAAMPMTMTVATNQRGISR